MLTLALARQSLVDWPPHLEWLEPGERVRLASCGSPARRRQFLSGRWLVRTLLAQASVDIDGEGRSLCSRGHANLSHSGDWVIAGAAEHPLGVDLEEIRPRKDLMGLARMVLSELQCQHLEAMPRDLALIEFYRHWTLKEAWFKARGQGLDVARLKELDFVSDSAWECDSAWAVLPSLGLVIAVHQPHGQGVLPDALAGHPLCWQYVASRTAR